MAAHENTAEPRKPEAGEAPRNYVGRHRKPETGEKSDDSSKEQSSQVISLPRKGSENRAEAA